MVCGSLLPTCMGVKPITMKKETVFLGDTTISLHTPAPHIRGGVGGPRPSQTQSTKICPNLLFVGGRGIVWGGGGGETNPNPKCQDVSKSAFSRGGVVVQTNIPKSNVKVKQEYFGI